MSYISGKPDIELLKQWQDGYCPIVNGIIYPDGKIVQLNIKSNYKHKASIYFITPGPRTSIHDLQTNGDLSWSAHIELTATTDKAKDLFVEAGEGGHGSDGFVAVYRRSTKDLLWVAFFDCSNPFIQVVLENDVIVATSNYGNLWKFPISSPESLIVT